MIGGAQFPPGKLFKNIKNVLHRICLHGVAFFEA
jgi:hypothetical protein